MSVRRSNVDANMRVCNKNTINDIGEVLPGSFQVINYTAAERFGLALARHIFFFFLAISNVNYVHADTRKTSRALRALVPTQEPALRN